MDGVQNLLLPESILKILPPWLAITLITITFIITAGIAVYRAIVQYNTAKVENKKSDAAASEILSKILDEQQERYLKMEERYEQLKDRCDKMKDEFEEKYKALHQEIDELRNKKKLVEGQNIKLLNMVVKVANCDNTDCPCKEGAEKLIIDIQRELNQFEEREVVTNGD